MNATPIGIENKLQDALWSKLVQLRVNHCTAVLVEQWRWDGERSVPIQNSIARVSRKHSEWSRKRARAIGTIHAYDDWMAILHAVQELNYVAAPIPVTKSSSGVDQVFIAPSIDVNNLTSGPLPFVSEGQGGPNLQPIPSASVSFAVGNRHEKNRTL